MKVALLITCIIGAAAAAAWQPEGRVITEPRSAVGVSKPARFESPQQVVFATGATSCNSAICHGGATPKPGEVFVGNEFDRWYDSGNGAHFRAFKVLSEDKRSDPMAKLLYGPDAVAKNEAACRACHAFDVEPERRFRAFDIEEGVTCEACHGRSGQWIGPHRFPTEWRENTTAEERKQLGFYDTRDLVQRAEKCLECHLGTDTKKFTHEILAAGHPPLTFELARDLFNVPIHWNDKQCYLAEDEGSWFHVRVWAVGQAVTLREKMRRIASWAASPDKADYALFECYACHHELKDKSWRQHRASNGELGRPVWDASTWAMCQQFLWLLSPDDRAAMERGIDSIVRSLSIRGGGRAQVLETANEVADLAGRLAEEAADNRFDREQTLRIFRSLTRDRERILGLGYRSAVQAFSAVFALYRLAIRNSGDVPENDHAIIATLLRIEEMLYDSRGAERPNDYDPFGLVVMLEELEGQLREW